MMMNAQVTQIRQLSRISPKSSTNSFCPIVNWSYVEEQRSWRRECIQHFGEHLLMRQLCSNWVPLLLTIDQKQQRVDNSELGLHQFQSNKKEFLCKYVKMDEMWIHHFPPESNRLLAEWTAAGENRPKWWKTQTSASKVLASVFWDAQAILFIDYLEKERTINSDYYIALLMRLKEEIVKKNGYRWKIKKCSFTKTMHCITNHATMAELHELHFELLPHLFYYPDLSPSDYWLFANLKRILQGKRFFSNEEMISEIEAFFGAKEQKRHGIVREALESVYYPSVNYVDE